MCYKEDKPLTTFNIRPLCHKACELRVNNHRATGNNIYLVTLLFLAIQGGWLDVQYFYFGLYLSTRL